MVSGSHAIFIMDKGSNFKFGMATFLCKLYETFEFEATIFEIQVTEVTKKSFASKTLCTQLSQIGWAKFDETWWEYPLRKCDEVVRF